MEHCRKLTPPKIARLYGISHDKVLAWIRSGELRAINVTTHRGGRPRYLVDIDDLHAFEQRRIVVPPPPRSTSRRRQSQNVKQFF